MARTLPRLAVLFSALGVAHVTFVGCGGSDEVRHAMDEAGAAGEGGEKSSGGSSAGRGGSATSGTGGTLSTEGGVGGTPVESNAGASAGGVAGPSAGGAGGMSEAGAGGVGGFSEAGGAGGSAEMPCLAKGSSRITMELDADNAEWVTNLQWLDSANTLIPNVAAFGGSSTCGDPPEFFGEAYGAPEGKTPNVVVAGSRSHATGCGLDINITNLGVKDCSNADQTLTTTAYHFYEGTKVNQLRVTRTIGFGAASPSVNDGDLRVWQPRVGLSTWGNVIYPNAAGTAVTPVAAASCPGDCPIATGATWNGQWFADLTADGHAIIVRRDPAMTAPVSLTVNYDSYSNANLASFVAVKPEAGWAAPITEVEYLCFADLTSWPQTDRDAAVLPAWCGP
jgi:hypothetical protein